MEVSYYYNTRLTALFLGLPRWASTRKVKPIWILLKQETVSGSGISWARHMQACISFQTDNHTSTPQLSFFTCRIPFLPPNQQCQSTEGSHKNIIYISVIVQKIKKLKSQLTFLTRSGLAIFWRPTYFVYWSMTAASQTVNKQEWLKIRLIEHNQTDRDYNGFVLTYCSQISTLFCSYSSFQT